MSDDSKIEKLASSLRSWAPDGHGGRCYSFTAAARSITANPQAHIDALVEAGVLEKASVVTYISSPGAVGQHSTPGYRVVAPHVHEWRVSNSTTVVNPGDTVVLRCDCGEKYNVPNRLPIEVPS